jgi:hypothetical protein
LEILTGVGFGNICYRFRRPARQCGHPRRLRLDLDQSPNPQLNQIKIIFDEFIESREKPGNIVEMQSGS